MHCECLAAIEDEHKIEIAAKDNKHKKGIAAKDDEQIKAIAANKHLIIFTGLLKAQNGFDYWKDCRITIIKSRTKSIRLGVNESNGRQGWK